MAQPQSGPLGLATPREALAAARHDAHAMSLASVRRVDEAERATRRGSWEWDVTTNRAIWSEGMYLLFGLDSKTFENTNENFLAMVHPDDRERMLQAMSAALARPGPFLQEYRLTRLDGVTLNIRGEGNVIADAAGKATVMYGFVQDITARKRAEEDLILANQELEAFAYSVSHDLRAPLRSMSGFAQILREDHGRELSAEARHDVDMIVDSAREMAQLVDDLLEFSHVGKQALSPQVVQPADLAQAVANDVQREIKGRDVRIDFGAMPPCKADPNLLKQVYANLIGNAIKYTRKRKRAEIMVGWDDAAQAYFVRDNGVGFDIRHADKLFGVFQRLHRSEDYEGTGVGLAIVRRIVTRQGGRTWATAEIDKGATFFFTLPGGAA